jgi:hypothetical protein
LCQPFFTGVSKDYKKDLDDYEHNETSCKATCIGTDDIIDACKDDCKHDRDKADNKSKKDFEKGTDSCYAKCFESTTASAVKMAMM